MYRQSFASSNAAASSTTSITETDGLDDASMSRQIQLARQPQQYFATDMTLDAFRQWPEFPKAREELFRGLLWLTTLLPGDDEVRTVREAILSAMPGLSGPNLPITPDLVDLYGRGKGALRFLCELLEKDQQPSTVAAACRMLRPAFDARGGSDVSEAFAEAVLAVTEQPFPAPRRGDAALLTSRPAALRPAPSAGMAKPMVQARPASAAEALPTSGDVGLAAALGRLGIDGVRQRCAQLGDNLDRLVDFVPPETHPSLRDRLNVLRDAHATPPDRFLDLHAELLQGGNLVLTLLCDKLEELSFIKRQPVFDLLTKEVSRKRTYFDQVSRFVNVLIAAESIDASVDNPHLDERRSRFKAWAAPLLQASRLTRAEVSDGVELLGLYQADTIPDCPRPRMHPVYNNAAWQACLGRPLSPAEVPALADPGVVDLARALEGLKKRCDDLIADPAKLEEFSAAWLAKKPSGAQDDQVVALQREGVDALRRIDKHLTSPGDRKEKQAMLSALMDEMAASAEPAAVLIRHAHRTAA